MPSERNWEERGNNIRALWGLIQIVTAVLIWTVVVIGIVVGFVFVIETIFF